MPLPYSPGAGSVKRALRLTSSMNACGIWISTPAPSPVLVSAAAGAAMIEILQDLERLLQDPMRLAALDVDDETDAAGIVLEARVVESLRTRRADTPVRSVHATGRRLRTVLARRDAHGVSSV